MTTSRGFAGDRQCLGWVFANSSGPEPGPSPVAITPQATPQVAPQVAPQVTPPPKSPPKFEQDIARHARWGLEFCCRLRRV